MDNVTGLALCSACGVCAGVAPRQCLELRSTADGWHLVSASDCSACGICLRVCPWSEPAPDGLSEQPLGEPRACYVGYSTVSGERERGSSGALLTRLAKALIETKMVDGVIAPVRSSRQGRLFEPAVLRTPEEVTEAAGSKYYPVEFSRVLRELRDTEGRYALVGLPCAVSAVARARDTQPWVAEKIKYLLGLVCGQNVTAQYTDMLARASGVRRFPLRSAQYRLKRPGALPGNFAFVAAGADGSTGRAIGFVDSIASTIWSNQLLTPDACFLCPDLFAVHADASFMDAWLPPFNQDPAGTSIVVVRSDDLLDLIRDERAARRVQLSPIAEEDVLRSQSAALRRRRRVMRIHNRASRRQKTGESAPFIAPRVSARAPGLFWRLQRARFWRRVLCLSGPLGCLAAGLFLWYVRIVRRIELVRRLIRRVLGIGRKAARLARGASRQFGGGARR